MTLVVGIGSPHGDDQLGWLVVEAMAVRLRERRATGNSAQLPQWEVRRASTPADLLDWLPGPSRLILVDAWDGANDTAPWRRLTDADLGATPTRSATGHLIGLHAVLKLARNLRRLPDRVEIWAIRGDDFAPGSSPSDAATLRGLELASWLVSEVSEPRPQRTEDRHPPI